MESVLALVLLGISYYWNFEENKNKLIATIKRLNSRKVDVQLKISFALRPRKKLKSEAQLWLENVEKMTEEARDLENKVAGGGIMSRLRFGRSLCVKIDEAEKLYKMGNFVDGLVVDETNTRYADLSEKTERKWKEMMMIQPFFLIGAGVIGFIIVMRVIRFR